MTDLPPLTMKLRHNETIHPSEPEEKVTISSSMLAILDRKIEELLDYVENHAKDVGNSIPLSLPVLLPYIY